MAMARFGSSAPAINIIVGPNASAGKTNILEAILVLARGSSYRAKDAELVKFGQAWARLDTHLANSTTRTIKLTPTEIPAKALTNSPARPTSNCGWTTPFRSFYSSLITCGCCRAGRSGGGSIWTTSWSVQRPATVRCGVITGGHWRSVIVCLSKGRGALAASQLGSPWDIRLSELAGQVVRARHDLAAQMNKELPALYCKLADSRTKVSLDYLHQWPVESYESHLLKHLERSLPTDQERGFTGAGPHREDFTVLFDVHPAQETASRGEVRTAVLALKIIELQLLQAARGSTPLLLLDDVFSELDGKRRHALTDYLAPYQTFITTTDADIVLKYFVKKCTVIPLS